MSAKGSGGDRLVNPAKADDAGQRPRAKAVDVAARAQVSIATVSLVANGKAAGRVSESTSRRVLKAIEELGYVVNSAARSLATGRRQCVALVASDMTNPFISTIAAGVSEALGTQIQLLLAVSGSGSQTPDVEQVLNFGVDGVLLDFPMAMGTEHLEAPCPVVLLDDPNTPKGASSVYFDLQRGARELANHLTGLGHQTIVYLDTPRQLATFQDRRRYLADQLKRHDKNIRILRKASDIEVGSARATVAAFWDTWERAGATAIVAASDVQAYGVLAALSDLGVSVPEQVSVASFDDLPFAAITSPPLTAISLSAFDLGFEAATLLQDIIERGERAQRSVLLPTQLVERSSTGPAKIRRRRTKS
jgi:LacI family transcriptional regulator